MSVKVSQSYRVPIPTEDAHFKLKYRADINNLDTSSERFRHSLTSAFPLSNTLPHSSNLTPCSSSSPKSSLSQSDQRSSSQSIEHYILGDPQDSSAKEVQEKTVRQYDLLRVYNNYKRLTSRARTPALPKEAGVRNFGRINSYVPSKESLISSFDPCVSKNSFEMFSVRNSLLRRPVRTPSSALLLKQTKNDAPSHFVGGTSLSLPGGGEEIVSPAYAGAEYRPQGCNTQQSRGSDSCSQTDLLSMDSTNCGAEQDGAPPLLPHSNEASRAFRFSNKKRQSCSVGPSTVPAPRSNYSLSHMSPITSMPPLKAINENPSLEFLLRSHPEATATDQCHETKRDSTDFPSISPERNKHRHRSTTRKASRDSSDKSTKQSLESKRSSSSLSEHEIKEKGKKRSKSQRRRHSKSSKSKASSQGTDVSLIALGDREGKGLAVNGEAGGGVVDFQHVSFDSLRTPVGVHSPVSIPKTFDNLNLSPARSAIDRHLNHIPARVTFVEGGREGLGGAGRAAAPADCIFLPVVRFGQDVNNEEVSKRRINNTNNIMSSPRRGLSRNVEREIVKSYFFGNSEIKNEQKSSNKENLRDGLFSDSFKGREGFVMTSGNSLTMNNLINSKGKSYIIERSNNLYRDAILASKSFKGKWGMDPQMSI